MRGDSYGGVQVPASFLIEPSIVLDFPKSAWATDSSGMASSGAGSSASIAANSAIGEHLERRHFNSEIVSKKRGDFSRNIDADIFYSFVNAFKQTFVGETSGDVLLSSVHLVEAFVLPYFDRVHIPTVCVSLSDSCLGVDRQLLPYRDTTGCAAHFDFGKSVRGSTFELLERQFLLIHWLTRGVSSSYVDGKRFRLRGAARRLFEYLREIGTLSFLKINPTTYSGSAILCVFRGREGDPVEYCIGLCFAGNPHLAAEKALYELWQSFNFLFTVSSQNISRGMVKDRYHRYFIECNRCDTAALMAQAAGEETQIGAIDDDRLYVEITKKFKRILMYANAASVMGRTIYFTKALSPDLFLHIDNSSHCNVNNEFSYSFADEMDDIRLKTMVPFP